jgi:hypothetical protein
VVCPHCLDIACWCKGPGLITTLSAERGAIASNNLEYRNGLLLYLRRQCHTISKCLIWVT